MSTPKVCGQGGGLGVTFVDATQTAGIFGEYFVPTEEDGGGGAVGDFNNDGYQDIFVLGGFQGDKLFLNDGDGTFTESALAWGVNWAHHGLGAAVGDYNGDGWLDIYVTSHGQAAATGQHRLYRNEAGTHFTNQAVAAGVQFTSTTIVDGFGAAFGDYDRDGDLDLFVSGWSIGNGNRLYQNQGNGTFTDVTTAALGSFYAWSFAPRFVDMDGDRYPELLLVADFGTSHYFHNTGLGTFVDYTVASGTGLDENGMGQTVADYNGDGRLDWYVTSIFAGTNFGNDPISGNKLYLQQPNHTYIENAAGAGIDDGGWGWGAVSIDFDHDGYVDIVETNGWNQAEWIGEQSYAFRNPGNAQFVDVSVATGIASHTLQGRGLASLDYDNDGDQDLVFFGNNDPVKLYRCDQTGTNQHWLRVFLNTAVSGMAPHGFGCKVCVLVNGLEQVRSIDGGSNYLSQSELTAHFGLGAAVVADHVRVEWSNGVSSLYEDVAVDQHLTLSPGTYRFIRGDCNGDTAINLADAIYSLGQVFNRTAVCPCLRACDANRDTLLDISDPIFTLQMLFGGLPTSLHGECVYGDTPGTLSCNVGVSCP